MKIWAHTMFKNSEKWLWYSVTSVIDHVDKILLWDTGSTDDSWVIAMALKNKYPNKISLKQYGQVTVETFKDCRQEMLDQTDADWFLVVDDDEIWWEESIALVIQKINDFSKDKKNKIESIVVPTINLIGDIYHKQPNSAGKYRFGKKVGHFNLRAVKRNIPGLHSAGNHGVWGWADINNKQIQDRGTFKLVDAPYLHASFLSRSVNQSSIVNVPKRAKKVKYELGQCLPLDFYYPESLFKERPIYLHSVWQPMNTLFKVKAAIETPFKIIKRRFKNEKVGY